LKRLGELPRQAVSIYLHPAPFPDLPVTDGIQRSRTSIAIHERHKVVIAEASQSPDRWRVFGFHPVWHHPFASGTLILPVMFRARRHTRPVSRILEGRRGTTPERLRCRCSLCRWVSVGEQGWVQGLPKGEIAEPHGAAHVPLRDAKQDKW